MWGVWALWSVSVCEVYGSCRVVLGICKEQDPLSLPLETPPKASSGLAVPPGGRVQGSDAAVLFKGIL